LWRTILNFKPLLLKKGHRNLLSGFRRGSGTIQQICFFQLEAFDWFFAGYDFRHAGALGFHRSILD